MTDVLIAVLFVLVLYLGITSENQRARRLAALAAAEDAAESARIAAEDFTEQQERDQAEAALGRKRVACKWCDGDVYVAVEQQPPHTCPSCEYKNGY